MKATGGDVSADSTQARTPWLMVVAAFAAGLGMGVGLALARRQVAPGQPQRAQIAQPMVQSVGGRFMASNLPRGDAVALLEALAKIDADGKQVTVHVAPGEGEPPGESRVPRESLALPAAPKPSPGKARSSAQAPPAALSPLAHPRKSLGWSLGLRTIPAAVPQPPTKTAPPPADELLVPWASPVPKIRHASNAPAPRRAIPSTPHPSPLVRRPLFQGRGSWNPSRKPVIERIHAGDLVVYRKARTQPADVSPFERVFGAMIEGRIARAREAAAQPTATESTAAPLDTLSPSGGEGRGEGAWGLKSPSPQPAGPLTPHSRERESKRHRGKILKFKLLPAPGAGRRSNGKSYRVLSSGSPTLDAAAPELELDMKSISRPDNVRLTRDVAF